jgi:lantibiotic biosynthesis protein
MERTLNITDCGFFVLRTPLLPIDDALRWGESLACSEVWRQGGDREATKQAWLDDLNLLRARLRKVLQIPEVIQALVIASPSLQRAIALWERDPECKKGLQAERALVRYFLRMAGRPTPFGLFSGCSVGTVRLDAPTEFELASREQYRSATRLDFDFLFALTSELRRDPTLKLEMCYGVNSSLHRIGDCWHYVESRPSGSFRSHHLVKLVSDEYLDSLLACSKSGNRSFAELIAAIRSCEGSEFLTNEEIENYLHEVIDSEILVPNIVPLLTGKSPLDDLLDQLREMPSAKNHFDALVEIRDSLIALDRRQLGVSPDEYSSVAARLKTLPAKVDDAHLLQVDMFKPVRAANLGHAVLDELYSVLDVLHRVATPSEPSNLAHFRDAFTARYDQQWVSLVEALDVEAGIGYGSGLASDSSPLLRGLPLFARKESNNVGLNEFQTLILQKIVDCARTGKNEVVLDATEFPVKSEMADLLPNSFSILASLVAPTFDALRRGEFELVLKGGDGPSSAKMLGRFCSADTELNALVRSSLREEEMLDPEAVYAEIVYLPEGRVGNVLCRPTLRDYEIVHLGRSGAPANNQLTADDLLLSVREGKILLYSRRLRCRIVPRMSNAHAYASTNLSPLYRLLCDLQNEGGIHVPLIRWGPIAKLNFLPRVRIGRVVVNCARWLISRTEAKVLCDLDRYTAFLKIKEMQFQRGMPRWVLLSERDQSLPVDLDNPLSVDAMLHLLKRLPEISLVEMYPQPDCNCVIGPEGRYVHEVLIPLTKKRPSPQALSDSPPKSFSAIQQIESTFVVRQHERLLSPGSEWQFVKIYGGAASLDDVLTMDLAPLLSTWLSEGVIVRWFFVRFSDPDTHLRLRFQTSNHASCSALKSALKSLLADRRLWKVQYDTYRREIERYGGLQATIAAEEIFCADSAAVLTILQSLKEDGGLDARWRIALLGINTLLTDCDFGLNDRLRLMGRLRGSFAREFDLSSVSKEKLSERFRRERAELQALVQPVRGKMEEAYEIALHAFDGRSQRVRPAIAVVRSLQQRCALAGDFFEIVSSYVHMHVNRIIRSSPRTHELVLYDFLYRLYDEDRARNKKSLTSGA